MGRKVGEVAGTRVGNQEKGKEHGRKAEEGAGTLVGNQEKEQE